MKTASCSIILCLGTILVNTACFSAEKAVPVFPPPPPSQSPIESAIDLHVHSGPDVFGRCADDIEVARAARRAGMRGLVIKNHITSTADRAALVSTYVPDIEAFGGVVLNRAVGGVNPDAVEWMYRMEGGRGKIVWLPTFDADHHKKIFNSPGEGIKVAEDGKVTPEMEAVLEIIARENLVLETGHVSPSEVLAVVRRAVELGVKKIVVTHAMAIVPGMSLEQIKEAAEMGAYVELVYVNHLQGPHAHLEWMREWTQVSIEEMAGAIRALGAERIVLGTDLGQSGNPVHPDGYKLFILGLKKAGITQAEIDQMMKHNPAHLLDLE
jgi:hypothetical protein